MLAIDSKAAATTLLCNPSSKGGPVTRPRGKCTDTVRGGTTLEVIPGIREIPIVLRPAFSSSLRTSPTDWWQRGHPGVPRATSTPCSSRALATARAFSFSFSKSLMKPIKP